MYRYKSWRPIWSALVFWTISLLTNFTYNFTYVWANAVRKDFYLPIYLSTPLYLPVLVILSVLRAFKSCRPPSEPWAPMWPALLKKFCGVNFLPKVIEVVYITPSGVLNVINFIHWISGAKRFAGWVVELMAFVFLASLQCWKNEIIWHFFTGLPIYDLKKRVVYFLFDLIFDRRFYDLDLMIFDHKWCFWSQLSVTLNFRPFYISHNYISILISQHWLIRENWCFGWGRPQFQNGWCIIILFSSEPK